MRVTHKSSTPVSEAVYRLLAVVAFAMAMALPASAQTQPGKNDSSPEIAQLNDRVKALRARDDLDTAVRDAAVETYQQAIAAAESARSNRRQAAQLQREARTAPAETRQINAHAAALEPPPTADALASESADALADRADAIGTRLTDTQTTLTDLRDQLARLAKRPEAAREALTDARDALQTLDSAVSGTTLTSSVQVEAERALKAAQRKSIVSEIARLQEEISGLDNRERLLEAKRMLAEAQLSHDNQMLAAVQRALGQRQSEVAQNMRSEAEQRLAELGNAPEPLKAAAQHNVELARELTTVIAQSDTLAARQTRQRKRAEDIQRRLNLVQRQLEIGGRTAALGDVLRGQKRQLAEPLGRAGAATTAAVPDVAAAELQRFQLQQEKASLEETSGKIPASAETDNIELQPDEQQSLQALRAQRGVIMGQLIDAESRYIDSGRDLAALGQQYDNSRAAFARLLDERLFWLPSSAPIPLHWLAEVARQLPWAFNPMSWGAVLRATASGALNRPIVTVIWLLVVGVLIGARRFFRRRLSELAVPVGNVRHDTVWGTLRALVITALLSIQNVVLLVLIAWLMRQATNPGAFTLAVATGILAIGMLVLFIEPFIQICRNDGLAQRHFLWSDNARYGLHRILRWLLFMLVLPTLLVSMTVALDDETLRETVGRGAFMVSSLVIAVFSWRLLHPIRGVLADVLGANTRAHWRLGYLWLPLAMGVPLFLAVMAALGYYYTALQLQTRFFYSAGLLGGCRVLYSLVVRWLTVAERRLALTRALRKREEARENRASREAAAAAGESAPDNLDTPEIDLLQISEQTNGLIKIVIMLLVGAGLWLIWANTLPALQLLDNINLWHYTSQVNGATQITNVTLGSLLLAIGVGVVTALAGRNLPGFLEITVLRRFSLNSGSRYAVATLFQYAIIITGLLVAVGLIGWRWSSIQWLVAAIGVGLGFGLQQIFANFISGILILFERPVRVGDTVTVGTLTGTVSKIRIRATTITDWDNKEIVIPNQTFITETVVNWTLSNDIMRLVLQISVGFDADGELVEKLIMEAIEAEPLVLKDPAPSVYVVGFADSSVTYNARVFYEDLYYMMPLQHTLYRRIHAALKKHGIEIVFPQQDLHLRSIDDSFGRFVRKQDPEESAD